MLENENNEQEVQNVQNTEAQGDTAVAEAPEAVQAPAVTDEIPSAFGQRKDFDFKDENGNVLRTYHFQFPGVETALEIVELSQRSYTEYRKQLLKQVVTDPEVRSKGLEWFDTHKGLVEVTDELDLFLGDVLNGVRG